MSTVGDTMSIPGGYHEYSRGYLQHTGGIYHEYTGAYHDECRGIS